MPRWIGWACRSTLLLGGGDSVYLQGLISNLSHGALLMLGSHVTYWLFTLYGVDPFINIIPALATPLGLGSVMHR